MSSPSELNSTSNQPQCCNSKDRRQEGAARAPVRRTRRWFLLGGSVLILLGISFWRPIQQRCLLYFLLRAEAPSEEVLSGAVEQASDPATTLLDLWRTQRIPHRQFVLSYLSRVSSTKPGLLRALKPVLLDAVADPDIAIREWAFATLARMKHPQLRTLALEQLSDADPAARLLGLQTLRSIANSNDVPIAMRLLNDPEPRVVVAAALVLRNATGQNFGIRSTDALPQFTCIETNPPPAPDLVAIRQGVERAQKWWVSHQAEFPAAPVRPAPPTQWAGLVTANFTLEGLEGKPIRLSQFRGKTVLLAFWSHDAPASLDDVPALKDLRQRYSDRLAVLGVCVPAASCEDEDEHGNGHTHHQHDAGGMAGMAGMTGPEHMHCFVQDAVARLKINYPMVADPQDTLGQRFSIAELPAYVLIDPEGRVRRRFVGFRTESALTAMVGELANPNAVRASAN